jgi:predicted ATPase/DNA-binding winged helix-turn-helix (wHTH) protein
MKDDAMAGRVAHSGDVLSFGRFELFPSERLLTADGAPVELGARTLDTLIALASRPNEVIGKRELMAEVWPDVTVEEGSLRFHIASLRKTLGDGKDGARYIATLAGRGYCFVAPVARSSERATANVALAGYAPKANSLPARSMRMVGRSEVVRALSAQLITSRFVTIVGPGGVGKTTVAVAVAHDLLESFAGAIVFVDLGLLNDPAMVCASLASMLGVSVQSDDTFPNLTAHLRDKRMLVILDNCEHVIDMAARVAAAIFTVSPELHILATSREPLRIEGEQVHRLMPLGVPPDDPGLTAPIALTYPAIQLFLERAAASGAPLDLTDANAVTVAHICRRLDGVALAIELAAGRVEAYGLQQTALLLDEHLTLLWLGQRTAPPRQKTLQATLDWSYGLLSELERVVFRRLAVFVGQFTLEAALAVVTSPTVAQTLVFGAVDSLVAKSLVATRPVGAMMRYRLLETTRAYALALNVEDSELADLAARHTTYFRRWLEQTGSEWATLSNAAERAPFLASLGNVRAALEWCFGPDGCAESGVALAAAAAPAFLALSLLTDCKRWSERALRALSDDTRAGAEAMHLQAAMGLSLMFTGGNSETARVALNSSLAIAEERADAVNQLRMLGRLHMFHHRIGEFRAAMYYAERSCAVAKSIGSAAATALARCQLGISLNYLGDLGDARAELEAALQQGQGAQRTSTILHGFDHYNITSGYLARTLWLQGYPDQATRRARLTVEQATRIDHPVTLSVALVWAISVFVWVGDLPSADEHINRLVAHAQSHSLAPYLATARGFEGELAIRRNDADGGVTRLLACLAALEVTRYQLLATAFNIACARGLAMMDRPNEGLARIDETMRRVEVNGDLTYMAELLRVKGNLLLSISGPVGDDAESYFAQALEWSRRQGARAWELRTAVDLAGLWASQGRPDPARALLQPVLAQFTEGADTADLKVAERLLARLG